MMPHDNDIGSQTTGLFDDDFGRMSRVKMLLYLETLACKVCGCFIQGGSCQ